MARRVLVDVSNLLARATTNTTTISTSSIRLKHSPLVCCQKRRLFCSSASTTTTTSSIPPNILALNQLFEPSNLVPQPSEPWKSHKIYAFGLGREGELGTGEKENQLRPKFVKGDLPPRIKIRSLSSGLHHTFLITDKHEVYCWGSNVHHQCLENESTSPSHLPSLTQYEIIKVCCGRAHTLVLTKNGEIFSFGDNEMGQLATGDYSQHSKPIKIEGLPKIIDIASGLDHCIALAENREVFGWGFNTELQLGIEGYDESPFTPIQVSNIKGITSYIACGTDSNFILDTKSRVYASGLNHGFEEIELTTDNSELQLLPGFEKFNIAKIAFGGTHGVALSRNGSVYAWGWNEKGRLGLGLDAPIGNSYKPTPIPFFEGKKIINIACGVGHSLALSDTHEVFSWGFGNIGRLGHNDESTEYEPKLIEDFVGRKPVFITCGVDNSFVVLEE